MLVSADNDPRKAGTIWSISLNIPAPVITPLIQASFTRIFPENAPLIASEIESTPLSEMEKRFASGGRCFAAWVDGAPVAQGWVSYNHEYVGELNLRIRLLPDEAYIWDCVTIPAYRRNYLYSALLAFMLQELRLDGLRRIWIGANIENIASQKGIARAGFQRVADLVIARTLALRLVWIQGVPEVPDSLVAEARRVFLDNREKLWLEAPSQPVQ